MAGSVTAACFRKSAGGGNRRCSSSRTSMSGIVPRNLGAEAAGCQELRQSAADVFGLVVAPPRSQPPEIARVTPRRAMTAPLSPLRRRMVLAVPRRLTTLNRDEFRRELLAWIDDAIARRETVVTLDLAETEDLDVSGIALLIAVQQRASLHGLRIALRRPNESVRQMLIISRMLTLFAIEP